MIRFTLYSRSYCHLCEEMLQGLQRYGHAYRFTVEVVDVDADDALVAQFDELVPVLFGQREGDAPVQLCHYFLDVGKLEQFLNQSPITG